MELFKTNLDHSFSNMHRLHVRFFYFFLTVSESEDNFFCCFSVYHMKEHNPPK